MARWDEDFECERCFKQAQDVEMRHDPQDRNRHLWLCDDCLREQQDLVDYLRKKGDESDET